MDDLKTLLAIEKIKRLKARYFRLMDLRHWDEWAELFTKDCVFTFVTPPAWGANNNETKLEGRDQIVKFIRGLNDRGGTGVHHGHMPEIDIIDHRSATGIWAMYDYIVRPDRQAEGYGHYHESYECDDAGEWHIASIRLTRIREDDLTAPLAS